ncbi:hypothetical protein BU26DRAFT_514740 [Trematosphaeria pertusa]|uniref:Uncharacterized protein n=1 Tax=Trematosphaeria pertusa TaxID=390896 RepID=A0A6A6IZ73_9PLEO|nr:uncharacterized protein BU26DRAFT_514740 [Trematosphaeria pertusa]KAF2254910.1 hypothetical protein BU26DRAFT_514740 [Trematosphaeria pertusa]
MPSNIKPHSQGPRPPATPIVSSTHGVETDSSPVSQSRTALRQRCAASAPRLRTLGVIQGPFFPALVGAIGP